MYICIIHPSVPKNLNTVHITCILVPGVFENLKVTLNFCN
uniref:Uncharacterized protein n=1 Tax=Arundo donax TaxID=35708 RepID=A0A0A9FQX4_ARUDO